MYYNPKDSGMRIANLRRKKGLTQEQLAEKLNISTSNLGKLERGLQGMSIDLLIEIGIFFGCQPTTYCLDVKSSLMQLRQSLILLLLS